MCIGSVPRSPFDISLRHQNTVKIDVYARYHKKRNSACFVVYFRWDRWTNRQIPLKQWSWYIGMFGFWRSLDRSERRADVEEMSQTSPSPAPDESNPLSGAIAYNEKNSRCRWSMHDEGRNVFSGWKLYSLFQHWPNETQPIKCHGWRELTHSVCWPGLYIQLCDIIDRLLRRRQFSR